MKIPALCLAFMFPLAAEFRSVEMPVSGLECASCAASVDRVIRKIKGVESAAFQHPKLVVQLKPGNTVPLEEISDALKRVGYTPEAATVEARGAVIPDGERWTLRLDGIQRTYRLDLSGLSPRPIRPGQKATVEGVIAPRSEVLQVRAIRTE